MVQIDALRLATWDGNILQGKMAEYAQLPAPVDALIWALGHAGDSRAVPPIVEKMNQLDADSALSHHRAVALSLERLADPAAAEPLADLLSKPGMTGHALHRPEPLFDKPMDKR